VVPNQSGKCYCSPGRRSDPSELLRATEGTPPFVQLVWFFALRRTRFLGVAIALPRGSAKRESH